MDTSRSSIPRLLRAASHYKATTLNLHRSHHTLPASFLYLNSSSLHISSSCFFSTFTSQGVHTCARHHIPYSISSPSNPQHLSTSSTSRHMHTHVAALLNPQSIWPYALTLGCIATGGVIVYYKYGEKVSVPELNGDRNDQGEFRFQGSVPHFYRKGHSVVVKGFFKPIPNNANSSGAAKNVIVKGMRRRLELYLSVTEVLAQPQQVAAALERNNKIFAEKQIDSDDKKQIVAENKEQNEVVNRSKSNFEGMVNQSALSSKLVSEITEVLECISDMFPDIPNLLRDGQSVFIKGIFKPITNEFKEDKSDDMKEDESDKSKEYKLDEMKENKWARSFTSKTEEDEYHLLAEAVAKHD